MIPTDIGLAVAIHYDFRKSDIQLPALRTLNVKGGAGPQAIGRFAARSFVLLLAAKFCMTRGTQWHVVAPLKSPELTQPRLGSATQLGQVAPHGTHEIAVEDA